MSARNDVPSYGNASHVKTSKEEKEKSDIFKMINYIGNRKLWLTILVEDRNFDFDPQLYYKEYYSDADPQ